MKRYLLLIISIFGMAIYLYGQNMLSNNTGFQDRVYTMANGTPAENGNIMDQEKTPDGKLAQLITRMPHAGDDPILALYNPYTGEMDWTLRLNIFSPTDMQVSSDSNGRYFIWVSTSYGEILKVDSAGQVVESFELDEIGGNLTGKLGQAGFSYQIMKMAWNLAAANTLYLCVKYFDPTQDGYGLMLVALNIANQAIIQQFTAFVIDGSGIAPQYGQYEIRDFIFGPYGRLVLLMYNQIAHEMTFMIFNSALQYIAGYASPFFWFDFHKMRMGPNDHLLLVGTENYLLQGGALLGMINMVNPGALFGYVFTPSGGTNNNIYWNFHNVNTDCPETQRQSSPACPTYLVGTENNYFGILRSFNPFLIEIPDLFNFSSTATRRILKADTAKGDRISISQNGTAFISGYTGRNTTDQKPWMRILSPFETNSSCETPESVSIQSFSYTLTSVAILIQNGVPLNKKSWSFTDYIDSLLFEQSCPRNCDLTAGMMIFDDTSCTGAEVEFISTSYGNPGPAYYAWRFSDGTVIQGTNKSYIKRILPNPGTYTVTLIVSDDFACVDSITDSFVVCPPPVAAIFAGDPKVCLDLLDIDQISFQDISSTACGRIVSREWKENGKTVSSAPTYTNTYFAGDTVKMTLIVTNSYGCVDSATVQWVYYLKPDINNVNFNLNYKTCESVTANFDAQIILGSAPIVSYMWTFEKDLGNGQVDKRTDNSPKPSLIETGQGVWNYQLIVVDANGCSDTFTGQIQLAANKGPIAGFNSNAPMCFTAPFTNVQFQDMSIPGDANIVKWSWDFGDGGPIGNKQNPLHMYVAPGKYNVKLTVTDANGCSDSKTQMIQIWDPPTAAMQAPDIACLGAPVQLLDKSIPGDAPINAWLWVAAGAGLNSVLPNPVHTFYALGNFVINLEVTDANGCTDQTNKNITIRTTVAHINGPSEGCTDEALQFSATAEPNTSNFDWTWDFGDGGSSTAQNPIHSFMNAGTYSVSVIAHDIAIGCSDQASMNVTIYTDPQAYYAEDSFCLELDSLLFVDSSTAGADNPINSWQWTFIDTVLNGPVVYYHAIDTPGWQEVTLYVNTVHQCSDSYTDTVYFFYDTLFFTGFKIDYKGHSVTLTDTSKNSIRNDWDFGDGTMLFDTSGPVEHYYASGGKKYLITMVAYSRCDVDTAKQWTNLIPTGIESQTAPMDFRIVPNPNNGMFNLISGKDYNQKVQIEISDLNGRLLWKEDWTPARKESVLPVDLRFAAKGLYFVKIITPDGHTSRVIAYQ